MTEDIYDANHASTDRWYRYNRAHPFHKTHLHPDKEACSWVNGIR